MYLRPRGDLSHSAEAPSPGVRGLGVSGQEGAPGRDVEGYDVGAVRGRVCLRGNTVASSPPLLHLAEVLPDDPQYPSYEALHSMKEDFLKTPSPERVAFRHMNAVRKLWWHGTRLKNLRRILKEGLLPNGVSKVFNDEMGQAGMRSIKTFGGTYLTDNFMTAYSASGSGASRIIVGVTYESRSPHVMADEDDVLGMVDWTLGSNYDTIRSRSPWTPFWRRHLLSDREGAFRPDHLDEVSDIIGKADISKAVAKFLGYVFQKWPLAQRGYAARKSQVESAVTRLLRAQASHLIENEIVSNKSRRIKRLMKSLKYVETDETDPERVREMTNRIKKTLKAINNPPPRFRKTWAELKDATQEVSRLIPEMSGATDQPSMRHNIRTMDPIGYRGKNRILMVVEVKRGEGSDFPFYDLKFHFGSAHRKDFLSQYQKFMGGSYRVLDHNNKVLEEEYPPGAEAPELRSAS